MTDRITLTDEERAVVRGAVREQFIDDKQSLFPAVESIVAARVAEALREAAMTPAAMRVNTKDEASCREWLLGWANEYDPKGGDDL